MFLKVIHYIYFENNTYSNPLKGIFNYCQNNDFSKPFLLKFVLNYLSNNNVNMMNDLFDSFNSRKNNFFDNNKKSVIKFSETSLKPLLYDLNRIKKKI